MGGGNEFDDEIIENDCELSPADIQAMGPGEYDPELPDPEKEA